MEPGGGSDMFALLTFTVQHVLGCSPAPAKTWSFAVRSLLNMRHYPKFRKGCDSNSQVTKTRQFQVLADCSALHFLQAKSELPVAFVKMAGLSEESPGGAANKKLPRIKTLLHFWPQSQNISFVLNIFKSQTWKCIWWLFTSLREIKGCVVM